MRRVCEAKGLSKELAEEAGVSTWHLSLTHSDFDDDSAAAALAGVLLALRGAAGLGEAWRGSAEPAGPIEEWGT